MLPEMSNSSLLLLWSTEEELLLLLLFVAELLFWPLLLVTVVFVVVVVVVVIVLGVVMVDVVGAIAAVGATFTLDELLELERGVGVIDVATVGEEALATARDAAEAEILAELLFLLVRFAGKIGRASCRERVL